MHNVLRNARAVVIAAVLVEAALAQGSDTQPDADWRFVGPGASLIGAINVQSILQSALVKNLLQQVTAKIGSSLPAMDLALGTAAGVSRVYFSITSRNHDADVLMLIKGRLDDVAAKALMQGAAQRTALPGVKAGTKAQPIGTESKMEMHRVGEETILFGNGPSFEGAIRRMERAPAAPLANPLVARSKPLAEINDFWVAGALPDLPAVALLSGGIRGFALGFGLQNDLRIELSLDTASAEMAQTIAAKASEAAGNAQKQQPDLGKLETDVQGATVHIKVSMQGDRIAKLLSERLETGFGSPSGLFDFKSFSGAPSASSSAPVPQPAPKRKSILIYGLDDTPREVPLER